MNGGRSQHQTRAEEFWRGSVSLPLPERSALLVSGAANWQQQDRYLPPEVIAPLHVVLPEGWAACTWFNRYRNVGISSIFAERSGRTVVFTTGTDLIRLRLEDGMVQAFDVPHLDDVHELTEERSSVLLANTGHDEALEVDLNSEGILWRQGLADLRVRGRPAKVAGEEGMASFHLNQVFRSGDRRLGLVHHIEGLRLFSHAQRRLTGHGSGGVLDLDGGWRQDLRLHAPHSVRQREDGWLVLNSGRRELMLLDRDWGVIENRPTRGWGRGAAVAPDGKVLYAGISGIRRRYARPGDSTWTGVEMIDLISDERHSLELRSIEQVNGVQLCPVEVGRALVALSEAVGVGGTDQSAVSEAATRRG